MTQISTAQINMIFGEMEKLNIKRGVVLIAVILLMLVSLSTQVTARSADAIGMIEAGDIRPQSKGGATTQEDMEAVKSEVKTISTSVTIVNASSERKSQSYYEKVMAHIQNRFQIMKPDAKKLVMNAVQTKLIEQAKKDEPSTMNLNDMVKSVGVEEVKDGVKKILDDENKKEGSNSATKEIIEKNNKIEKSGEKISQPIEKPVTNTQKMGDTKNELGEIVKQTEKMQIEKKTETGETPADIQKIQQTAKEKPAGEPGVKIKEEGATLQEKNSSKEVLKVKNQKGVSSKPRSSHRTQALNKVRTKLMEIQQNSQNEGMKKVIGVVLQRFTSMTQQQSTVPEYL